MATSRRSRTRRRNQKPSPQQASAGYHQDATYASLDIITTDNLKDGAVAELTPPSGQWSLPVAPVSNRNIDEESSLGFQAVPPVLDEETKSWLDKVALPSDKVDPAVDKKESVTTDPKSFTRSETVELKVSDEPLPITQAETLAVSKVPPAAVLETEALAKPVEVTFDSDLEIEAVDDLEIEETFDDEVIDEDRSVTTVVMQRPQNEVQNDTVEQIIQAETEVAAPAVDLETNSAALSRKQRSVLRSPLLMILGGCIGYAAAQWSELLAFYARLW